MNRQVLLVEDSPATGILARKVVESHGASFAVRTTGVDARFYLRECSRKTMPDLMMLGLNLPDMGGVELLRSIKVDPHLCCIPICMLAVSADDGDRQRSYEAGAASFIQLPVSHIALEQLLQVVLGYWLTVVQFPPK